MGPGAVCCNGFTADFNPVVVDDQGAAGFGSTADLRLGIVGGVTCCEVAGDGALIVKHAGDDRCSRRGGVHDDGVRVGWCTGIAGRIGDDQGERVFALTERWGSIGPGAVGSDDDRGQRLTVVDDGDGVTWRLPAAAKCRSGVIGGAAIGNWTGHQANVIDNQINATIAVCTRLARWCDVDGQFERWGRRAFCAFRVFFSKGNLVRAFA